MDTSKNPAGDNTMLMSVLSYLGPLVIIPYLTVKDNPSVRFHVKQGAALFGIEVILWVFASMVWYLWPLWNLINFVTIILSILGIVNASQGKQKVLPLVGHFAEGLKI